MPVGEVEVPRPTPDVSVLRSFDLSPTSELAGTGGSVGLWRIGSLLLLSLFSLPVLMLLLLWYAPPLSSPVASARRSTRTISKCPARLAMFRGVSPAVETCSEGRQGVEVQGWARLRKKSCRYNYIPLVGQDFAQLRGDSPLGYVSPAPQQGKVPHLHIEMGAACVSY